jgi:hypothetical protein
VIITDFGRTKQQIAGFNQSFDLDAQAGDWLNGPLLRKAQELEAQGMLDALGSVVLS